MLQLSEKPWDSLRKYTFIDGNEYRARNLVLTGTMVDVSKVKIPPDMILH
jgi:hypothetical protein